MSFRTSGFHASALTCTVDGLAHLVSDDAAADGVAAGRGTYEALCGHTVHAAALVSSAGEPCAHCAAQVEVPVPRQARRRRRHVRTGRSRLWRLLGHDLGAARSRIPTPPSGTGQLSPAEVGATQQAGAGRGLR